METINEYSETTLNSLQSMLNQALPVIANALGALAVLIIGYFITKLIAFLLNKALKVTKIDQLTEIINKKKIFGGIDIKFNVAKVIVKFVKWCLMLIFFIVASDIMQWNIVSEEIGNILRYLPKLFSALALFLLGLYIARFIKDSIKGVFDSLGLSGAGLISSVVFYIIAIIVTITALNQSGIDTTIITNNLTVILGAFMATLALAFGLGTKDIVRDLLKSFYTRKTYKIGDRLRINGEEGVLEAVNNVSISLKTPDKVKIIPVEILYNSEVEIIL